MCIVVSPILPNNTIPDSTERSESIDLIFTGYSKPWHNFSYHGEAFEILNVNVILCSLAHHKSVLDPWRVY